MSLSVVTFGEVMGRLTPKGMLRWPQALPGDVEFTFGGGEANVAVSLAVLGAEASFVTALPRNPIADACVRYLDAMGVDTSRIVRTDEGRLGLYYLEGGANQRASVVTYDRAGSSLMLAPSEAYNWASILQGAKWFHITGITPALSRNAADATLAAVRAANSRGLTVSCDLNFRRKLWSWHAGVAPRDLAERTMRSILPFVNVVVANEEDAEMVLGIAASGTDVGTGVLRANAYPAVAREVVRQFPNVSRVAVTLRESISATHNNWGGMLYDAATDTAEFAPHDGAGRYRPYEIKSIVDRVGAGDAFAAALIYALSTPELSASSAAVAFAAAASCLKHSIPGDANLTTRSEAEALMKGHGSGRVKR